MSNQSSSKRNEWWLDDDDVYLCLIVCFEKVWLTQQKDHEIYNELVFSYYINTKYLITKSLKVSH